MHTTPSHFSLRTWWNKILMLVLLVAGGFSMSAQAQTSIQLGSGTGTVSYFPLYYLYDYSYSQTIYTAAEMTAAGASGAGTITKIRYQSTSGVATTNWKDWVVYMGNTTQSGFASTASYIAPASMTSVFSGTLPANTVANAWMEITLTTPFMWDGTSNLVVAVDENTAGWGNSPGWSGYTLAPSSGNKGIYFYQDATDINPASPSASASGAVNLVAQIQFTFAPNPCTGQPTAGTLPTTATACTGSTVPLSATGTTAAGNLTYQWLESATGSNPWTPVSGGTGATTPNYTTAPFSITAYYRLAITCTNSGLSDSTNVTTVSSALTPPYAVFDGISLVQDFENWVDGCATLDNPSSNWLSAPSTGVNSWRRDDQGASAGWLAPGSGTYSPVFSSGAHSARFHTVEAPVASTGTLDYYVNMSAAIGTTKLKFAYINLSGSDALNVSVSTNGGTSFSSLTLPALGQSSTWSDKEYNISSTSATTIIRFTATSDLGTSDIGLDNVRLFTPCSGTPTAAAATASPATICPNTSTVITATGISNLGGISLQWEGYDNILGLWSPISGATTNTYTTPLLSAGKSYRLKQSCSYSAQLSYSNTVTVLMDQPIYAVYNNTSFTEDFESWASVCGTNEVPSTNWRASAYTGNNSWRRNDQGASAAWTNGTLGGYTPVFTTGAFSARFHSYTAGTSQGSLNLYMDMSAATGPTRLSFDHINTNGTDSLQVLVSLNGGIDFAPVGNKLATSATWTNRFFDFASNSATTVIRLIATGGGTTDIGVDNLVLAPAPNCITPLNLAVAPLTFNSAILTWNASVSNPSNGYEWEVRTAGAAGSGAPGLEASGTVGAGTTTATATPLTFNTIYTVFVRANCGGGEFSAWAGPVTLNQRYCIPAPTGTNGTGITNVAFGSLTNTTGVEAGNYGDYTALTGGDIQQTLNANVAITYTGGAAKNTKIWVDWNNNLVFDEPGELMYSGLSATPTTTLNASFNVGTHALGAYRMRIGGTTAAATTLTPCYNGTNNGTFEDYTLNITAPPSCIAPTALTVGSLTGNSGTLNWTASPSSPGSGYEVFYNTTGTPATPNDIPQATGIMGTSYVLGSLTPGVTVYAWVRANCDNDGSSIWNGPVSFTPGLAQIGSGTASQLYFPIRSYWNYSYSQQIYLASEYPGSTYITKIKFKPISGLGTIANYKDWVVYMGNTPKSSFTSSTDWVPLANLNQVFNGTITPVVNQWLEITLTVPFLWDGTSNIVVAVDENTALNSGSPGVAWQSFTAPTNRGILYYDDSTNPDPNAPPTANWGPSADLAQVQFVYSTPPACLPPAGLYASNITATSANLGWTNNTPPPTGYQWEIRTTGAGGTGSTGLTDSGTSILGSTSTSLLTGATTYGLYVRTNCGGIFSTWAGPYTFTTPCVTATVPFIEGFETGYLDQSIVAGCWSQQDMAGTAKWTANNSVVNYNRAARSGSFNAYLQYGNTDWLFRAISLTGGTSYRFSAYARQDGATATNASLTLAYGTTATDAGMTNIVVNAQGLVAGNYQLVQGDFTPATTGVYYVGIKGTINSSPWYISLDDISVVLTPSCLPPAALATTALTSTTASFSWTASTSNPANGYQWEVRTSGIGGGGATGLIDSGNTAAGITTASTSMALAPNTTYNLYVRGDCGLEFSPWTGPYTFTTACSATTVPYAQDFDLVTPPAIPSCMSIQTISGSAWQTIAASTYGLPFTGNIAMYSYDENNDADSWLFTQALSLTAGTTYRLSYKYGNDGGTTYPEQMNVWYGASASAASMTELLFDHGEISGVANATSTIDFTPIQSGIYNIGFHAYSLADNDVLIVDEISVVELSICAGMPDPGNTTGPASACSNATFNLGISNSFGSTAGLSYQWETSADGATWAFAPGASTVLPYAAAQTEATWYRVRVICTSGDTAYSTGLKVNMGDACQCGSYCSPSNQGDGACITSVSLNTLASTTASCVPLPGYTVRSESTTLGKGLTYPLTVTTNTSGYTTSIVSVWFDWNNDAIFSTDEWTQVYLSAVSGTVNITVPLTAYEGTIRMRVRSRGSGNTNGAGDACTSMGSGTAEDYCITVVAPTSCTGIPAPGATTGPSLACSGVNFTLGLSNAPTTAGISYQWYASTDGGSTFSAVGTNAATFTTSMTQASIYYCDVTCDGGATGSSTPISVAVRPANQCYCTPSATGTSYYINNFTTTGATQNISNTGSGFSTGGYGNFTAMSVEQDAGMTVNFTADMVGGTAGFRIWVDWNQDGTFSETEVVYQSSAYDATQTGSFSVPVSALGGSTRMRIGSNWLGNSGPTDPCLTGFTYGEFEDYTMVVTLPPCLPPGGITVTPTTTSANFSWTASASSPNGYNWEVRTSGAAGSGSSGLIDSGAGAGITASTSVLAPNTTYSLYVRSDCGSGIFSNWSAPYSFFTGYCVSTTSTVGSTYFTGFSTTGGLQNISNTSNGQAPDGYADFTSQSVSTFAGGTINFASTLAGGSAGTAIWVDWNNNMVFDATERMFVTTAYGYDQTGTFMVPTGTPIGDYRMRIRCDWGLTTPAPCGIISNGETEDYTFTVTPVPACLPPTGLTASNITLTSANLSWTASGSNPAGYEWEVRTSGAGGSGNSGLTDSGSGAGTTVTTSVLNGYTTYSLYVRSNCVSNLSDWAGPMSFYAGYCIPGGTNATYYINSFITTGGSQNISNTESGYSPGSYGDFSAMTVSQDLGGVVNFSTTYGSGTNTFGLKIWVDWNHDLVFSDPGEVVYASTGYATSHSGSFTVPVTALAGTTRMRIGNSYTPSTGPANACLTNLSGEYEDYTFNVTIPSCITPGGLAVSNVMATSATLNWNAGPVPSANGSEWEIRTTGAAGSGALGLTDSGITASGVSTATTSVLSANTTYSLYVRNHCNGEFSAWAGPMNFTTSCAIVTSFFENFDGVAANTVPNCWAKVGTGGSVYTQASSAYSAPNTLYIYSTSTTSLATVQMRPVSNLGAGTHRFRFNLRANVTVGGILHIGYLTNPVDANSFQSLGTVTSTSTTTYSEFTFTPPAGSYSIYPAFRAAGAPANSMLIDDVRWEPIPTCIPPTNLAVTNISPNGSSLGWTASTPTPANGYQWEVRASGAAGSGATGLTDSGTAAAGVTSATTSLLTTNTTYYLYVRSNCGGGDLSTWAGPVSFTTPVIAPSPWSEPFATTTIPTGWTTTGWTLGSVRGVTGNPGNNIYKNIFGASSSGTSFTTITVGPILAGDTLSFDYKASLYASPFNPPPAGSGNFVVALSTNFGTTYTDLGTTNNDGVAGWRTKKYPMAAYVGQYVKVRITGNWVIGDWDYGFDNFKIEIPPTCLPPAGLAATNITVTGASLSWTASTSAPANGYQWEVRASGAAGSGATGLTASGTTAAGVTTATTNLLTTGTTYSLYVRSNCGGGDVGPWAGPVSFTTVVVTPSPWSEPFATTSTPTGWTTTGWLLGSTRGVTGNPGNNIYKNIYGTASSGTSFTTIIVGPIVAGDILSFDHKASNYSSPYGAPASGSGSFVVALSTNFGNTYTDLGTTTNDGVAGWRTKTFPLGSYVGQYVKVRITGNWVSGDWDYGFDNFKIEVPPTCLPPTGLVATNITINGASLSWTASTTTPANGYQWEVRASGAAGSGATGLAASGNTAAGVTTANVSGMSSSTSYSFYVRANCGGGDLSAWSAAGTFTTSAACGDAFTDTGGASAAYGNNENWVKTICRTTPGDQVRVLFSSFITEANYDKLFIFNGSDVNAPKFASTSGAGFGNTDYGAGGWSGDLTNTLPGPFTSSNASGCLTFAFVSDVSTTYPGWTAITQCVTPNNTCAASIPVLCGNTYTGVTSGVPNNLPANACAFNGPASTGGQNWFQYVAGGANESVTLSTCGQANFDTRISVFGGADCSNLSCVALGDDSPGCANGSSELTFIAQANSTYWIAVHGAGAAQGSYSLTVTCDEPCTAPANDNCAGAIALSNNLADGTGTPATYTNVCAGGDGPTTCSGALPVQGVWFSFNSGPYNHNILTLLDNGENGQYTASTLDYTLYTGTCAGLGATGSAACAVDAAGTTVLNVTPNTDYMLLVYNTGGSGVAGTFGLMVQHPAQNDASITAIITPVTGLLCGSTMAPQVTLLNNGDVNLTSVQIIYGLSAGVSHTYNWTGNLAYGASVNVTLPTVTAEAGLAQTLTVATNLPNGMADGITANDSKNVLLDVGGEGVMVNIMTDANPGQISWTIYDDAFNAVANGGPYAAGQANTLISAQFCLSTQVSNCYILMLADSYGDGLCCANGNGYWELRTPAGGLLLRDLFDGAVDGNNSPTFNPANPNYGFGHSFCLPAGPANIAPTECGIFNNLLGNKVYANKVTGAANYQFEFSDPDAGFFRRIARPYNYVHLWDMVTNPLTPGVKYFARVRTDRDGAMLLQHFGTGCEMGIGLAAVACTQLIPAPAYGHSCNEVRTFNTNNSFIYATPVQGATEYQFRIFNTQEGYDQTFTRSTYILQLKWNNTVAPPLISGYTYAVSMNVKVNGLYSGFCTSQCNITIDNSANRPEASMVQANGTATMWPNPVRDGQVNLNIDGLVDAEQHITIDIQDIYGKQVFAKEFGNSGERFNTILNLSSDIASGVYMVNITVNGERTVQRLSIIR